MTRLEELAQQLRMLRDACSPGIHPVALAALIEVSAATIDILDALDMRRAIPPGVLANHSATPAAEPAAPPAVAEGDAEMGEGHAREAVRQIFADLRDRRFLKWLFPATDEPPHRVTSEAEVMSIDLATQTEIAEAWVQIIRGVFATLTTARPAAQAVDAIFGVIERWGIADPEIGSTFGRAKRRHAEMIAAALPAAQAVTDEMREEIKRVLARWHRNSCYPEAMDIDLDLGVDLLTAALSARQEAKPTA